MNGELINWDPNKGGIDYEAHVTCAECSKRYELDMVGATHSGLSDGAEAQAKRQGHSFGPVSAICMGWICPACCVANFDKLMEAASMYAGALAAVNLKKEKAAAKQAAPAKAKPAKKKASKKYKPLTEGTAKRSSKDGPDTPKPNIKVPSQKPKKKK